MLLPYMLAAALHLGSVRPFTGKDLLPTPAFTLQGHDINSPDDDLLLPIPFLGKDDDGNTTLYVVYTSPVAGECGIFTTEDNYASMDHVLIHGAFKTKAGQRHLSGGVLAAADDPPEKVILFVVCLPMDVKTPEEARAKAKYSTRFQINTADPETS